MIRHEVEHLPSEEERSATSENENTSCHECGGWGKDECTPVGHHVKHGAEFGS